MMIDDYKLGDYVVISCDDNNWNDKIGIVEYKNDDYLHIFCVGMPNDLYIITHSNINTISKYKG